jgi:hypothetical protein
LVPFLSLAGALPADMSDFLLKIAIFTGDCFFFFFVRNHYKFLFCTILVFLEKNRLGQTWPKIKQKKVNSVFSWITGILPRSCGWGGGKNILNKI